MKNLLNTLLTLTLFVSASAFAHGDGHGKLADSDLLKAAQTSAKMLTFKARGMSVGKLDKSWSEVVISAFEVVEQSHDAVIIKAINEQNQQALFFKLNKGGKVLDVKDAKSFQQGHGHSH